MADVNAHELPRDMVSAMKNLEGTLQECNKVLKNLTEVPLQDSKNKLEPLEKAKLDLTETYAINSLFWIYLVTQGVNAADHPIKEELERVKKYMGKIKNTEEKVKGATMKLDKPAAKRFIAGALWAPKDKSEDSKVAEAKTSSLPAKKNKRKIEESTKKQKKKKKKTKQD